VRYWRCVSCGFAFTTHFDALSPVELGTAIYNEDYILADPGFPLERPRHIAGMLAKALAPIANRLEALDFGGGEGTLAALMRAQGFAGYASFDPYFDSGAHPGRRYELVTAFEVVEHSRDPLRTFRDIGELLCEDGAALFSTLVQPRPASPDWWYIAPRNGHVSIHTGRSLAAAAARAGLRCVFLSQGLHLLYRAPGGRVPRVLAAYFAPGSLWHASHQDGEMFLRTASHLVRLGRIRAVLNPRPALRVLLGGHRGAMAAAGDLPDNARQANRRRGEWS